MEEDHSSDGLNIGESLRQIAGSDVIILNKVDLVSLEQVALTEDLIKRVNPTTPIHRHPTPSPPCALHPHTTHLRRSISSSLYFPPLDRNRLVRPV